MLTIEMLPARHGDALVIEYGNPNDPFRIVIDGGPYFAYEDDGALRSRMADVKRIDLLVMTHVDIDHVDGIIRLLQDEALDIEIEDVWFNGFDHIEQAVKGRLAGVQGEYLGALLKKLKQPWNANEAFVATDGAVVVPSSGVLPVAHLPGGATATIVSPGPEELDALADDWIASVKKSGFKPGDTDDDDAALKSLEARREYGPPKGALGDGPDKSAANGSSIGFVFEWDGHKLLLPGDAWASVLEKHLATYVAERGPLEIDAFKLPHHGSFSNVSRELLELMAVKRYLVSSDGSYYKHPDRSALRLILKHGTKPPHFVFNYRSDFTKDWLDGVAPGTYTAEVNNCVDLVCG